MPIGVFVTRFAPLPETTGGRKRGARLLEAAVRAGITPHVVAGEALAPEAVQEAGRRGWVLHAGAQSPVGARGRLAQQLRRDPVASDPRLVAELRTLAGRAAFVQLEEIGAFQYARHVPSGVPVVASPHNVDSVARRDPGASGWRTELRLRRMALAERRAVRTAVETLCVSDADRAAFAAAGARSTLLVPNGVDDDLFAVPPSGAASVVLFFGAFGYEPNRQGVERFLDRIWPAVRERLPAAELHVAGVGMPAGLVDRLDGTAGVRHLGFVPDLLPPLAESRLVIAPIWFGGGTRMKVLEAMAAGRPVVGTRLGVEGIGFEDGRHGLVADDDGPLAARVVELLEDRARAAEFGAEARTLASGFRWTELTRPLEALYRRLAGSG